MSYPLLRFSHRNLAGLSYAPDNRLYRSDLLPNTQIVKRPLDGIYCTVIHILHYLTQGCAEAGQPGAIQAFIPAVGAAGVIPSCRVCCQARWYLFITLPWLDEARSPRAFVLFADARPGLLAEIDVN